VALRRPAVKKCPLARRAPFTVLQGSAMILRTPS
jgi:hypothetical protein